MVPDHLVEDHTKVQIEDRGHLQGDLVLGLPEQGDTRVGKIQGVLLLADTGLPVPGERVREQVGDNPLIFQKTQSQALYEKGHPSLIREKVKK